MPPDFDLRPLYHAPLADFVAARADLARRLRQAKDPRAAEVRTLRKPSLSAWAINQLFAHEPDALAALIAAGERARAAQVDATGGSDPRPLRDLLLAIRRQTAELTERAAALLAAADRAPGEAIVERIRHNLDALALDPASAPVAERGWLDVDLEPPGFEIVAALQIAAAGSRAAKGTSPAPPPAARTATVDRLDDRRKAIAERKERERRERLERLRADLAGAEAAAAETRAAADEATREADAAARELAAAEERATAATERASEAGRRAEEADAAAARARQLLEDAERDARGG
jgi:hypothetical protein